MQQAGLHKAQQQQPASRGTAKAGCQGPRDVLKGCYKEFPRGSITASAWHLIFLVCKEIFSRIFSWAMASAFCDVSALRSGAVLKGEEGQLCWERVTPGARAGTGQHPWALNPLLSLQQSCCCPRGWDQALNQVLMKRSSPGGISILSEAGNPCWQQVCSWISWMGGAGCQLWVQPVGHGQGPAGAWGGWGCTPGSCGFVLLPPMMGLRRFGELCVW